MSATSLSTRRLQELLDQIRRVSVAVFGDFCLDSYWTVDPRLSEDSIETGKPTTAVRRQRCSLGGAGNVVANLCALGVGKVRVIGVLGDDLFGREMLHLLRALEVNTDSLLVQQSDWTSPAYCKPHIGDEEQSRLDFGVANVLHPDTERKLLAALELAVQSCDAIILNQQLKRGVNCPAVIAGINALVASHPDRVFLSDARDCSELFRGVAFRLNGHEAARVCGQPKPLDQIVLLDEAQRFAETISSRNGKPVFLSRGARGALVHWQGRTEEIPAVLILKKTDPVGAGDTSVSAIAAALAAGASPLEAAQLANFASAVTVQKLQTTGTATPQEILEIGADPDYVYRPELADDPRAARYCGDSEIEIVQDVRPRGRLRYALFDHDGTISTLRQGWEPIMEEVFERAILGPIFQTADESVYRRVVARTRDYIQRSTGIQTITQMQALVEMVREFGHVPAAEIKTRHEYKRLYLDALMQRVRLRLRKLERGELDTNDLTIKGAIAFLRRLRERGVTLILASGTDHQDVVREAQAMGYAELFDGGIFGAVGDIDRDAKREVIRRILRDARLDGTRLVCFGDGPVELRETKKRGGLAVGIASDEVRRYSLSAEKRSRLIRAGADIVAPDFSQPEVLMRLLALEG